MKNKKRVLSFFTAAVLMMTTFSACGTSNAPAATEALKLLKTNYLGGLFL